jgi:uncharacterized RDD family membrane protein YckC
LDTTPNINISELVAGKPRPSFKAPDIGSRIGSAFLDQTLGILLRIIIWLPFFFSLMDNVVGTNPFSMFTSKKFIAVFVGISTLHYLKDIFNGRSIGKRAIGLQLLNAETGGPASPIRTAARGFGLILFPVEVFMLFLSPSRRLGDYIAGTRLVETSRPLKKKFPAYQYFSAAFLALILSAIFYSPVYMVGKMTEEAIAVEPAFRNAGIVEQKIETEDLAEFFRTKYNEEFENVALSVQGKGDAAQMMLVNGSFILKRDLFTGGEIDALEQKVKTDLLAKLNGKNYNAEISIVYVGSETPRIRKFSLKNDA